MPLQGGAPPWILVQKEIADDMEKLRTALADAWQAAQIKREANGLRVVPRHLSLSATQI